MRGRGLESLKRRSRPIAATLSGCQQGKIMRGAIPLRRRSARMRRIDGLRSVAEMVQNPLDDCGLLDAGDDA